MLSGVESLRVSSELSRPPNQPMQPTANSAAFIENLSLAQLGARRLIGSVMLLLCAMPPNVKSFVGGVATRVRHNKVGHQLLSVRLEQHLSVTLNVELALAHHLFKARAGLGGAASEDEVVVGVADFEGDGSV